MRDDRVVCCVMLCCVVLCIILLLPITGMCGVVQLLLPLEEEQRGRYISPVASRALPPVVSNSREVRTLALPAI